MRSQPMKEKEPSDRRPSRERARPLAVVLWAALLGSAAASCDAKPLTRAQLYGVIDAAPIAIVPDAGPPLDLGSPPDLVAADVSPPPAPPDAPVDQGSAAEVMPPAPICLDVPAQPGTPACDPQKFEGFFSGLVVDACEPTVWIDANISLGGQRRCSGRGKGSFDFSMLPAGCPLTLVAAKPGYEPTCANVTAPHTGYVVRLMRVGGCSAPRPVDGACVCTDPGCPMPY
jgi:hypothetical protein